MTNQQTDSAQPAVVPSVRLRKSVATLTDADLAGLQAALVAMQGISDERGYQHYAGIHGLPDLPLIIVPQDYLVEPSDDVVIERDQAVFDQVVAAITAPRGL